jgi:chemotaxis protein histidine kinase CheA/ActR/RegA family two-component response regulator
LLDREDVESLREEIADGLATLADALAVLRETDPTSADYNEALQAYGSHLRNITMGASLVGLDALGEAGASIERNLDELPTQDAPRRIAVCELLQQWPGLCLSYLATPEDPKAGERFLALLSSPHWATPLDPKGSRRLARMFMRVSGHAAADQTVDASPETDSETSTAAPDALDDDISGRPVLVEVHDSFADDSVDTVMHDVGVEAEPTGQRGDSDGVTKAEVSIESAAEAFADNPEQLSAHASRDLEAGETSNCTNNEFGATDDTKVENAEVTVQVGTEMDLADIGASRPGVSERTAGLSGEDSSVRNNDAGDLGSGEEEAWDDRGEEAEDGVTELLVALRGELVEAQSELTEALEILASSESDDPTLMEAVERYEAIVERLWSTCDLLGLTGLQEICTFITNNLLELAGQDRQERASRYDLLAKWPQLVLIYLQNPSDDASCKALISQLQDTRWPSPLSDVAAKDMLRALVEQPSAFENLEDKEERPGHARPEHVALQVPEDVSQEVLDAFLHEAPLQAAEFSQIMQRLYEGRYAPDDIKHAQRLAHTLKGSAHLTGIHGVATLTHHMEDILEFLAAYSVSPPQPLVDALVEAGDCVEAMIDAIGQTAPAPVNAVAVLQRVLDWANRIDQGAVRADDIATLQTPDQSPPAHVLQTAAKSDQTSLQSVIDADSFVPPQVLRVPTGIVDELLRLVGELSMSINQIQDRYRRTTEHARALHEQDQLVQERTFELEDLVDIRGVGVMQHGLRRTGTHDETFDPLELNEYNELHSTTQGVIEAAADARELRTAIQEDLGELDDLLVRQQRLNKVLQQAVMSTRMVPVRNIASRLQRAVRQTARATHKQVQLQITGEEILIDGEVLQKLGDPLMHILRNAVDHGIEPAGDRLRQGKPESGNITLHFSRMGNTIIVRCADDGAGLDYERIRSAGIERGLIEVGTEPDRSELVRLLYTPGFSTYSLVTQTSGRGIGLDIVHTAVIGMKGSLEIESQEGCGCEVVLRLPVSLITAHVLLVQVNDELYGIPTTNLEQILASGMGELQQTDDELMLRVGEQAYPAMSVANMLNASMDPANDLSTKPALLVHVDQGIVAVAVDRVVDGRDLVVKSMGHYVKDITGVLGAAILGDGAVVPVLDLAEMLRMPVKQLPATSAAESDVSQPVDQRRQVLIVDDSLSARRSLSQLLTEAGYRPLLAKDGLEAVDVLQEIRPDLVLVDLEMPRMNGLEFTAHVRANKKTESLPIIVITSRSTEKHKKQATLAGANAYITKPFQENKLLDLIEGTVGGA